MIFFYNLRIFWENNPPTRHIKYQVVDVAPSNKSFIINKLPSTTLERFLRRIKSSLTRNFRAEKLWIFQEIAWSIP